MICRLLLSLFFAIAFLATTPAEARMCRTCGGFRRVGPIRRFIQNRRAPRGCRSCGPNRCGGGNCGGSGMSGSGGPHGNNNQFDPGANASTAPSGPTGGTPNDGISERPIEGDDAPVAPSLNPEQSAATQKTDACLSPIEEQAKSQIKEPAVPGAASKEQENARKFLDLLEQAKQSRSDFDQVEPEKKLYYFLEEVAKGDPTRDKSSLWYKPEGMNTPQNFHNFVTALGKFGKAQSKSAQQEVLQESVKHLGWLTSRSVSPLAGSKFSEHRPLYVTSQNWLQCLKKREPSKSDSAPKEEDKKTPPPAQQKNPEPDLKAKGAAVFQSQCMGCHNGSVKGPVSSGVNALKRVLSSDPERRMPQDSAPIEGDELEALKAFLQDYSP